MLELVRYIHLNPLRAKIIQEFKELKKYPFCGHSALMGKVERGWQEIDWILKMFSQRISDARRRYQAFVEKGISMGRREDLTGGGLIRSMGGWQAVKTMRKIKVFEKSDERILGNGIFVEQVLSKAKEQIERKYRLKSKGFDLEMVADRVSSVMAVDVAEIWKSGKTKSRVSARSLFCFWAVRELGISMTEVSRRLNLSLSGVSQSVIRGEKICEANGFELLDK